jgi:hypothetical protein
MTSTSTQRDSQSSSSTPRWGYDIFLSFYGKDTRKSFTNHLRPTLKHKALSFLKLTKSSREENMYVSDELLKAIQESM